MGRDIILGACGKTADPNRPVPDTQIGSAHFTIARHDHGVMNGVFQLTDIAGPVIAEQHLFRILADRDAINIEFFRIMLNEMPRQRQDVAGPATQRRQFERGDTQPVIQVGPKVPDLHCCVQIDIGSGNQAHIQRRGAA